MKNWDTLAIEFVEHHLRDKNYRFGNQLVRDTMTAWAEYIHSEKLGKGLTYLDTFAIKDSTSQSEPPIRQIDTLVIYPDETKRDHILRGLTCEWVYRYWQRFLKEEDKQVERYSYPLKPFTKKKNIQLTLEEIMTILKSISVDDGLDFMASLSVAWARRFNTTDFIMRVRSLGYKVPATDRDYFVTRLALWLMASAFQLEFISQNLPTD
jgi:hypothetical protein